MTYKEYKDNARMQKTADKAIAEKERQIERKARQSKARRLAAICIEEGFFEDKKPC